ncbi:MAG: PqqD family protein [Actinomycetes bacterium]
MRKRRAAKQPAERLDLAIVLHVVPGVAWVEVEGEVVAYDPATSTTHILDPIGAIVWQCLDGESTLAEIVTDLAEAFAAPYDKVLGDVNELLVGLRAAGVVQDAAAVGVAAAADSGASDPVPASGEASGEASGAQPGPYRPLPPCP